MTMHGPLLRLLQSATRITVELVLLAKHFTGGELSQTGSDGGVLLDVDGQIQEQLVPG